MVGDPVAASQLFETHPHDIYVKKDMLEKMDAFTGSCPALVHLLKQCQCHVPKFGTSTDS